MNDNDAPNYRSLGRIGKAFNYSLDGLKHAAASEAAFQQELIVLGILSIACLLLPFSAYLQVLLLIFHILILAVELLNAAIEALADKICTDTDPLIKQAKDMGSAAVLLIFVGATLLWGYAFYTLL
jgi:diacylglycerol kinase (ATP)